MLTKEAFDFIEKNKAEDPKSLAFKTHGMFPDTMGFLLNQIKLRQKTKKKLPTWYSNTKLLFPTNLSSEQCSSEITSEYKASLFSGNSFIDLTGGLGLDTWAFSKQFAKGVYVEQNEELSVIAQHNLETLNATNVEVVNKDGISYLEEIDESFDLIYVDPDRRPSEQRVYDFTDCAPNILEHLDLMLRKGKQVLIKASPMLNIDSCVTQLKNVSRIIVVSYKNECKEILFVMDQQSDGVTHLEAIELDYNQKIEVEYPINSAPVLLSEVQRFVYDPFVAYRKAGLVEYIADKYAFTSFNPVSSMLTSAAFVEGFPGRIFKRNKVISADKKSIKKEGIKRANIITRGFFLSSDLLHKQLKLDRGGDVYLVANKNSEGKVELYICEKIA